jgi:MYXO-CTERM domain-containing protein
MEYVELRAIRGAQCTHARRDAANDPHSPRPVDSQSIRSDDATLGCAIAAAALAGVALVAVRRRRQAGSRVLA